MTLFFGKLRPAFLVFGNRGQTAGADVRISDNNDLLDSVNGSSNFYTNNCTSALNIGYSPKQKLNEWRRIPKDLRLL